MSDFLLKLDFQIIIYKHLYEFKDMIKNQILDRKLISDTGELLTPEYISVILQAIEEGSKLINNYETAY